MPYTIRYDSEKECVFATFTGNISMPLVREYIAALLPVLEETDCHLLLSDCLEAEVHLSSRDIMQFPKMAEVSPLTTALKRAALAPVDTSGYEMYEAFSRIQGHSVRVFTDRSEAAEWLLSDED